MSFFDAMRYPFLGLKHLLDHRELWPYAIKSFVVGLLLFIILAGIAAAIVLGLPGRVWEGADLMTCLIGCASVLLGIAGGIFLFAVLGNIVAGPFLEAMTERMMADAGRLPETPRGYWAAFASALKDQAGRLLLFAAIQGMLLTTWLTPAAFLQPVAAVAVSIFFVSIEHLEYPLEARGLRFFARIEWSLNRLKPALGFGATLFFIMPVAGFVLLPAAVCGAVLLEQELESSKSDVQGPTAGGNPT